MSAKRNFSSSVEQYFTSERSERMKYFLTRDINKIFKNVNINECQTF